MLCVEWTASQTMTGCSQEILPINRNEAQTHQIMGNLIQAFSRSKCNLRITILQFNDQEVPIR